MYDKMTFQNSPTKLANNTWYCTGINQKFIVVANGHIIQLIFNVYHIFSLYIFIPFFNPSVLGSSNNELVTKNPARIIGANNNWSAAIDVNTLVALGVDSLKNKDPKYGKALQYHMCSIGAKYTDPTMKRFLFLAQSTEDFLSTTMN